MIQILDSMPKKPKFLDQLMTGAQNAGQQLPGLLGNMAENQGLQRLTGQDFSGLSPDIKKTYLQKLLGKKEADVGKYEAGLEILNRMRSIKSQGNLGWKIANPQTLWSPEARSQRAEYEQLGKSLISLASTIPIRNKSEFETLAKNLYDPTINEADIEGILNGMERIIKENMSHSTGSHGNSVGNFNMTQQNSTKDRPPLSSFHR